MGTRLEVRSGMATSLGSMIDGLAGRIPPEGWIEVKYLRRGQYAITASNLLRDDDALCLSASVWDKEISLGEHNGDGYDCFGLGEHVIWQDVSLDFNEADNAKFGTISAPNIRRIREALKHMAICAWDPQDI